MSSGTTAGYNAEQLELLADYEEVLVGKKSIPGQYVLCQGVAPGR